MYRLVGHLFPGRCKAILAERDGYLVELSRCVVLNAGRARMVGHGGDWPWSSYRAMMRFAGAPTWLQPDWVLGQFATDRSDAQTGFAGFVAAGAGQPSTWTELRHQVFLGNGRTARTVHQQIKSVRLTLPPPKRPDGTLAEVEITAILATELEPPPGEEPIDWL